MALTNATTLADYGAGIGTQGATLKVDATNKRVGVGTDSPAGPEGSLQVGTGITFFGNTGIVSAIGGKFSGDFTVGGTLTYEDVSNIDAVGIITAQSHVSIADSILHTGDTDTSIRFPSTGTFTINTDGTERLRVTSTGLIGIGNQNPNSELSVNNASSNASVEITRGSSGAEYGYRIFGADGATSTALKFFPVSNGSLGSEAARFDASGRFLLGTTTEGHAYADNLTIADSENCGLTIRSGTSNYGSIYYSDGTSGNSELKGQLEYNHSNNALSIYTDGSYAMRVDSSGRLLLGTTTEGHVSADDFTVAGSGDVGITIRSGTSSEGSIMFSDGTSGADEYRGWINYNQSSNFLRFFTNATERLRIDSDGHIGIGTDIPAQQDGNNNPVVHLYAASSPVEFRAQRRDGCDAFFTARSSELQIGTNTDHRIEFRQNDSEVMRLDTAGRLLMGTSNAANLNNAGGGSARQAKSYVFNAPSTTTERYSLGLIAGASSATGVVLNMAKTRATSNTHTVVQDDDELGQIRFLGSDGTNYVQGARIEALVDGTPGSNDMPGRLVFSTTADGASSPTERMRIDRQGRVGINDTTPDALLDLGGDDADIRMGGSQYFRIKALSTGELTFNDNDTNERLRIDSSGRLLVGKQTHSGDALFVVETEHASGGIIGEFDNNNSGNFGGMRVLGGVTDRECRLQSLYGNSFFTFYTEGSGAAAEAARIRSDGIFLVGQTNASFGNTGHILNPNGQGYHICSGDTPLLVNRQSNDGELVRLAKDGTTVGSISNSGADVTYGQFCGSHWGRLEDGSKPEILPGTILETINKSVEWKVVEFEVDGVQKREAYNGSEENGASVTVEYEGVSYTGTVADEEPDSENLNKHVCVKVSDTAASKAVFGVFFGWDESETEGIIGTWNDMNIASLGNYYIRIKSGQSLEIGDLIESDGTGCGVVQSDDIIKSKTVAKVTSTTPLKVYTDGSFLVTCVLYSG